VIYNSNFKILVLSYNSLLQLFAVNNFTKIRLFRLFLLRLVVRHRLNIEILFLVPSILSIMYWILLGGSFSEFVPLHVFEWVFLSLLIFPSIWNAFEWVFLSLFHNIVLSIGHVFEWVFFSLLIFHSIFLSIVNKLRLKLTEVMILKLVSNFL